MTAYQLAAVFVATYFAAYVFILQWVPKSGRAGPMISAAAWVGGDATARGIIAWAAVLVCWLAS